MIEKINNYISNLPLDKEPQGLYAPIKYVMSLGGKRVRPTLMLLAYKMWKDDEDTILPQAVALEMYHNFTLLHDDVMDNAEIRRGNPTVHVKWNVNTAILSGDEMLCLAFGMMLKNPASFNGASLSKAFECFAQTTSEINEGQQYDIDFESRTDVKEEEYIEMIRLKTSVLLACATKIGALLADAPSEDVARLYRFGEALGLSFQLQDDYLDVYGNASTFGKSIGGDIIANKKTFMLINAMQRATGEDRERLMEWIGKEDFNPQEKIHAITSIYDKLGIDKLALQKIEFYYKEAIRSLDEVNVPAEGKASLRAYAEKMLKRNR